MTEHAGRESGHFGYLMLVALVAAIGGLLFGYDTAVINGANVLLREHFDITSDAVFVAKVLPETKGKSLEEIEKTWLHAAERRSDDAM